MDLCSSINKSAQSRVFVRCPLQLDVQTSQQASSPSTIKVLLNCGGRRISLCTVCHNQSEETVR